MPEKILVPLDGSKLSEIVLPYVEGPAMKTRYEGILVSVRSPAEGSYQPDLRAGEDSSTGRQNNSFR